MRTVVLMVLSLFAIGCSAPYHVVQLKNQNGPANGVRYVLKRPSFSGGLRLTGPAEVEVGEECKFSAIVAQKLDQQRFYEVQRPPWYKLLLYSFSDTSVSIVLDDKGHLSSVTAKETDQALEVVKAVVDLAQAATAAMADRGKVKCADVLPPETAEGWDEYLEKKKVLADELKALKDARATFISSLDGMNPIKQDKGLVALTALDARIKAANKTVGLHYLPMHETEHQLVWPGDTVRNPAPFFVFKLKRIENAVQ